MERRDTGDRPQESRFSWERSSVSVFLVLVHICCRRVHQLSWNSSSRAAMARSISSRAGPSGWSGPQIRFRAPRSGARNPNHARPPREVQPRAGPAIPGEGTRAREPSGFGSPYPRGSSAAYRRKAFPGSSSTGEDRKGVEFNGRRRLPDQNLQSGPSCPGMGKDEFLFGDPIPDHEVPLARRKGRIHLHPPVDEPDRIRGHVGLAHLEIGG